MIGCTGKVQPYFEVWGARLQVGWFSMQTSGDHANLLLTTRNHKVFGVARSLRPISPGNMQQISSKHSLTTLRILFFL